MSRILDFTAQDLLEKIEKSTGTPPKPAKPPKETQMPGCKILGGLGTLGRVEAQIADSASLPEPAADASAAEWRRYFDSQIRMLNNDLAAEGTSLGKELAKFSGKRPDVRSAASAREQGLSSARTARVYLAEFTPGPDAPDQPCACGDTVFWRRGPKAEWRCRSCKPPRADAQVKWFVLPRRR